MKKSETRIVFVSQVVRNKRLVGLYRVERTDGHALYGPAPWRDCVAWRWRTLA